MCIGGASDSTPLYVLTQVWFPASLNPTRSDAWAESDVYTLITIKYPPMVKKKEHIYNIEPDLLLKFAYEGDHLQFNLKSKIEFLSYHLLLALHVCN